MNSVILTGKIASEITIKNNESKNLLCRFDLIFDDRLVDCIVIGMETHKFRYDVEKGMQITIEAID